MQTKPSDRHRNEFSVYPPISFSHCRRYLCLPCRLLSRAISFHNLIQFISTSTFAHSFVPFFSGELLNLSSSAGWMKRFGRMPVHSLIPQTPLRAPATNNAAKQFLIRREFPSERKIFESTSSEVLIICWCHTHSHAESIVISQKTENNFTPPIKIDFCLVPRIRQTTRVGVLVNRTAWLSSISSVKIFCHPSESLYYRAQVYLVDALGGCSIRDRHRDDLLCFSIFGVCVRSRL